VGAWHPLLSLCASRWCGDPAMRDRPLKARIEAALLRLREEPRPAGAKRLVGQGGLMRLRVGEWRIVYAVREREVVVLVLRIGPRGKVYERMG
jgi:mRNA interferase RelE/StbE